MLFSASIRNVAIFASSDRRCGHGIHHSEARNKQVNSADVRKKNLTREISSRELAGRIVSDGGPRTLPGSDQK